MLSIVFATLVASPGQTVRVDGEGFLRLSIDGRAVFARSVALEVIGGRLGGNGATFLPVISCYGDVSAIEIDLEGNVTQGGHPVGRLVLGLFDGVNAPTERGGFYVATDRPKLASPGEGLAGVIRFGSAAPMAAASNPTKPPVSAVMTAVQANESPKVPTLDAKVPAKQVAENVVVPKAPAGGIGIGFRSSIEVSTESFTFADIAEFSGDPALIDEVKQIVIASTPVIGAPRKVDSARILAKLRAANIDLRRVRLGSTCGVLVARAGQTAADEEFTDAAIAAVEEKFGKYGSLSARQHQPDMALPMGTKKFLVDDVDPSRDGFRALVSVYVEGKLINRRVVVLERVGAPPLPKVGESVRIRVCAENLQMETTGRISKVGRPGDPVEVTTAAGVKLTGIVIGAGLVEVR